MDGDGRPAVESAATSKLEQLQGFDDFVETVLKDWKVPGAAVAIARDGEIVLAKGYGLRDRERELPVTTRTLFAIGSATKAFTAMTIALLADEGKLDWDTPVRTYLPTFRMHDPFASERMTPRDLVTHRSGLPRHDLMWYGSPYSRDEIVARLQYLEPNHDLRTAWQYQNLMYLTAGYLAGYVDGSSWEDLVRRRIFDRLDMRGSNVSVARSQEADDHALPYHEKDDKVEGLDFRNIDAVGPAGSINSNVDDMATWLLLHLNRGKHKGEQFVSEGQMAQLHTPQMVIPDTGKYAEVSLPSYALGWFVESYRGHTTVHHGGNIDGFSALVTFMPRENVGLVVLTNMNGSPAPGIIAYNAYDRLLGLDEIPWNERFRQDWAQVKEAGERGKEKSATDRVEGTRPSHPPDAYVGDYAHPGYGTITIARDGDELMLAYNAIGGPLRHYHYDVFEHTWELFDQRAKVVFATNARGDIDSLSAPLEPTVADIVFKRVPDKGMTDRAFLERFTGAYEVMGMTLTVSLKGEGGLLVVLPGQPEYELEPYKGTEFRLKGLSGFSIEFAEDGASATITQPGAVVTATRKA